MNLRFRSIRPLRWLAAAVVFGAAACADQPTAVPDFQAPRSPSRPSTVATITCSASIQARSVECAAPSNGDLTVFGGQNVHVKLTSSNVSAANGMFEFDVTVQNLLNEAIGTPDGVTPDPAGTMVFFMADPATVGGNGLVSVDNEDGTSAFTAGNQVYFTYPGILSSNQVSEAKRWRLAYGPGVTNFSFTLKVASEVQPLLVINEVMVNPLNPDPANPSLDTDREWFEVYNAGTFPVQMEGMLIADSAASGRRPYHRIASPLTVPPGGYVVIGQSTNTVSNGGVPVDYAYGGSMALANSLDALKISRTTSIDGDTLTIDRTQYASAAVSAQAGISRELKNPALDNSNMDGSNWADASVTSVYGNGGRGTPRAQNSTYTP